MADAEREQEAVERRTATRVDGGDQIGGRYLRPAFAVEKLVLCQLEDVGGRLEETVPKEALDMDDAQTFDVERVARHEMRSEEHTSELQSLMRISYAVFCLKHKNL